MEGKIHLSDGEWKLMNLLWDRAPQTITELVRALASDTGWSKYTVIKMLSRMEEKGAVHYEEGGRAKRYYPAAERQAVALRETRNFLKKVYGGSLGLMMSALVEDHCLSRAELEELHAILQQAEEPCHDA